MKFDYLDSNKHINHQISHRGINRYNANTTELREVFRSKRIQNKTIMFCLILTEILVALLITGYYISPLNRISNVSITGNHTIMPRSIISDMQINPGDHVLRLVHHRSRLEKYVYNQNVQLKTIHVGVHDWNHVDVKVTEYPIIAYLNNNNRYFAVTNNGRRAYQDSKPDEVDPIIFNFKSNRLLEQFIKSYKGIPDSVKPDINKIYYAPTKIDPNRVRVDMNDGNRIYANFKTWDRKMKYYPAISKSMKENGIINFELGAYSRVFKKSNRK